MRIGIYIRVSTEEQSQHGFSIDGQKERLIAFCKSQGWEDYTLYIDDGFTGTNIERPALKRLIRNIEEKKINIVLVYKLDRLGRRQLDVLHLLEDVFEKSGVSFKSATEPFDTSTPLGKAMLGILAVFAQLERDMIIERTTFGRRQRFNQGLWYGGRIPYGYSWNKEEKRLEIIPEEALVVKEIFKRYIRGDSLSAISDWAVTRTKSRYFDHTKINNVLFRITYTGKLQNAGVVVEGKHEPIIDYETWEAARRENAKRRGGLPPVGEYLLTGLLECSQCGGPIVHVRRKKSLDNREAIYEFYACKHQHVRARDRRLTEKCSLGYQHRKNVEKFVIEQIKATALNPMLLEDFSTSKEDYLENEEAIKSLEDKLIKVHEGLENLYDAIQAGEIKASAVRGRIRSLEEEQEAILAHLEDLKDTSPNYKDSGEVQDLIKQIGEAWDYLTFEEQKTMIRSIIKKVVLNKKAEPTVYWNVFD
ncbi:recombinase family protein [Brevibacillus laterosporus]|uniref:recombinase family protein n=1 Tax=Brevibacillus laterosporus TaxID=1465 RepID=UPI0035A6D212